MERGREGVHRLQLEIIRSSNDQSVFAWSSNVQIGSILADDPSSFWNCSDLDLMNHDEFIKEFPELSSTDGDHFDVFPITNRGIQIWMPFRHYHDSNSVFQAYLPLWDHKSRHRDLRVINLVLWDSNYYRYPSIWPHITAFEDSPAEFRQVYVRYQDTPNHTVSFDIDDSAITENGFICSNVDPRGLTGNMFSLTNANPFCVKTYSEKQSNSYFQVYFGQCLGLDWVHLDVIRNPSHSGDPLSPGLSYTDGALKVQVPGGALSMADAPSRVDSSARRLWIRHLRPPGSTWIVRIYRIAWEKSKIRLQMEVLQDPYFKNGLDKWNAYNVEVSDCLIHVDCHHDHSQRVGDPGQALRGLMVCDMLCNREETLEVDGIQVEFSLAKEGTKVSIHALHALLGLIT